VSTTRRSVLAAAPALALAGIPSAVVAATHLRMSDQLAVLQAQYFHARAEADRLCISAVPRQEVDAAIAALSDAEDAFLLCPAANLADAMAKAETLAALNSDLGWVNTDYLDQLVDDLRAVLAGPAMGTRAAEVLS
jgi:hypothetical protein